MQSVWVQAREACDMRRRHNSNVVTQIHYDLKGLLNNVRMDQNDLTGVQCQIRNQTKTKHDLYELYSLTDEKIRIVEEGTK
jgi:hypothetical protein